MIKTINMLIASLVIPVIVLIVLLTSKDINLSFNEIFAYVTFTWVGCIIMLRVGSEIEREGKK